MRVARATAGERTFHGEVAGDELHVLEGDVFTEPRRTGETLPLAEVTLLAPIPPRPRTDRSTRPVRTYESNTAVSRR